MSYNLRSSKKLTGKRSKQADRNKRDENIILNKKKVKSVMQLMGPMVEKMFNIKIEAIAGKNMEPNKSNKTVINVTQAKPITFYDRKMNPKKWMVDFENIAKINNWTDEDKISYMPLSLSLIADDGLITSQVKMIGKK